MESGPRVYNTDVCRSSAVRVDGQPLPGFSPFKGDVVLLNLVPYDGIFQRLNDFFFLFTYLRSLLEGTANWSCHVLFRWFFTRCSQRRKIKSLVCTQFEPFGDVASRLSSEKHQFNCHQYINLLNLKVPAILTVFSGQVLKIAVSNESVLKAGFTLS